ncbi:YfiT family bacillithiol transferase [Deinococcus fonticola]|uniref:YfiT family bacillithiol transferase n=1 Tax=Deinococcus fonticola TaxID=2528713 RepID=UPI001074BEFD|nr:putative metal-dependent hydrolase [Deinococcus fonticola]
MLDERFPIGPAPITLSLSPEERREALEALRTLPVEITGAVAGLSDDQLDTPYREGGWTVRQVVHHLPDSHLNAYVRMKLVLTEPEPTIKPWSEADWAGLPDSQGNIRPSLELLSGLHARWVSLYGSLSAPQWARCFVHPQLVAAQRETGAVWARAFNADEHGRVNLDQLLATYAWHGRHHTAHILKLRQRRGW